MECITANIDYNYGETINLVPIGDTHLGDINCDVKALKEQINWVLKKKNTYTILMGDLCNSIVASDSKRYDPDTIDPKYNSLEKEFNGIIDLFQPLADKGKILASISGNHEGEIYKRHHFNISRQICKSLKVPYAGSAAFIKLKMLRNEKSGNKKNTSSVTIFATHGYGGGRSMGAKVNKLGDLMSFLDFDIGLMGHNHTLQTSVHTKLAMSGAGKLIKRKVLLANTGTFLHGWSDKVATYAERNCYPTEKIGVIKVIIDPETKDLHASI